MENPPDWVTLTEGEEVVWAGPPSPVPYAIGSVVPLLLLVGGLVVLFGPVGDVLPDSLPGGSADVARFGVGGVLGLAGLLGVVGEFLRWYSHSFLITTEEVYHKRGIVSRDVTNLPLDGVENTNFSQSVLGRLLSYGDVRVATAGTDRSEVVFAKVRSPEDVVERITRQMAA